MRQRDRSTQNRSPPDIEAGPSADRVDAWMEIDGELVAPMEIAGDRHERNRGLLGRDRLVGALVIAPTASVHTIAMRFAIDVAMGRWAEADHRAIEVIAVRTLPPGRATRPRLKTRVVIEAEAGSFERWGIVAGVTVHLISGPPQPAAA